MGNIEHLGILAAIPLGITFYIAYLFRRKNLKEQARISREIILSLANARISCQNKKKESGEKGVKPMILILEDEESRMLSYFFRHYGKENILWTTTAEKCIELLRKNEYDEVWLDHDLGLGPKDNDGTYVADVMVREGLALNAKIFLHTCNSVAGNRMFAILKNTHDVVIMPFFVLPL